MSTYVVLAAAAATTVSLALAAGSSSEALDDPSTGWLAWLMTIVIVLAIFLITVIIACLRLFRIHLPDAPHPQGAGAGASVELTRREQGGLDADAISALPLVVYRDVKQHRIVVERDGDGGDDNELECSVCLNNFLDDDMLRILPTCDHVYHPHCIDPWLKGHTNCPLCRASLLDVPEPAPQLEPQAPALQLDLEPQAPAPQLTDPSPDSSARLLIGDASDREEGEDSSRLQLLARNRRAVGLRSNSTGHDVILGESSSRERFALRLPEHVRAEIIRTPSLRHVTSAVESSRFREGSAHGSSLVATAVARLLPRFSPGAGLSGDGDAEAAGSSSFRRRENSARGAVGEEKRSF